MLITFDECYDNDHTYLILSALFNPRPKDIHREFLKVKRDKGYVDVDGSAKEIKYTYCNSRKRYIIAAKGVECFKNSQSFFRAIVIDQRPEVGFNIGFFGKRYETKVLKEARAYKKFTELLLKSNVPTIENGVLLTDRLTRCKGDKFCNLIRELFGTHGAGYSVGKSNPVFRHIQEVDTALEQYHIGQIGDILQGVILNELVPTKSRWKRKLRDYVKKELDVPSLSQNYWQSLSKWQQDQAHPKYQIWYWRPDK